MRYPFCKSCQQDKPQRVDNGEKESFPDVAIFRIVHIISLFHISNNLMVLLMCISPYLASVNPFVYLFLAPEFLVSALRDKWLRKFSFSLPVVDSCSRDTEELRQILLCEVARLMLFFHAFTCIGIRVLNELP